MLIQAITIFPEMFDSITEYGVTGRAKKQNLWQFQAINPRKFADNKLGYIGRGPPLGGGSGNDYEGAAATSSDRRSQTNIFSTCKSHLP